MLIRNQFFRSKQHYSNAYSPTIASKKNISPFFQAVKHAYHAPAVPDQPIKASMTYWLVSNAFAESVFRFYESFNQGDEYAIN
jgi:hypothetical protein